jgi:hypothetical protein
MAENPLTINDFELAHGQGLGKGYISQVRLARHKTTGKHYALKIVQ